MSDLLLNNWFLNNWETLLLLVAALLLTEFVMPDYIKKKVKEKMQEIKSAFSDRKIISEIAELSPVEFKKLVEDVFTRMGYKITPSNPMQEEKFDFVAEKNGVRNYIKCKKYQNLEVGMQEVRDFYWDVIKDLGRGRAYFVTSSSFTREARDFAMAKPLELMDTGEILKYVRPAPGKNGKEQPQ